MAALALFKNRLHAGQMLAEKLLDYQNRSDCVIVALPRGGVTVGFAMAQALNLPLDVLLVGKLGVPWNEEYGFGAIAVSGERIVNADVVSELGISPKTIETVAESKLNALKSRQTLYRSAYAPVSLKGRVVIVVDDGLATGLTMRVALQALRPLKPSKIIVAVPVAAAETVQQIRSEADDVVCLQTPLGFYAVGMWYENFKQVSDEEVLRYLATSGSPRAKNPLI